MSNEIDFNAEMQELADVLAQYAPENWESMAIRFEPQENEGTFDLDACAVVSGETEPVDPDEDDLDAIERIFGAIKEKSVESWKAAIFTFTNDGECEIEFEY